MHSASFYAFLKLIKNQSFTKENDNYFRWLAYAPALLIRERSVNSIVLTRTISSLNTVDMEMLSRHKQILKTLSSLYDPIFLKSLKIIEH